MAALNFPPSPALNDVFTSSDRSWKFNGVAWQLMPRTTDNILEGTTNLYYTDARVAAAPAVTALQSDLATEVSTRTTEIARIDTRVDSVLSNIDPVALDSLTEVVTAFQNADGSLSDALTALSTAATSALGVETAARIAGDSDLQTAIDAEATRAQGVEAQLTTDLASEVTARTTAISTEQSTRAAAITAEQTARAAAISTEQTARAAAISAEQTARETAISSVNTRVDSVLSNIDPVALDSLTEVVAAFQDADGSLSDTIANLTSSSAAAVAAIDGRVTTLEGDLDSLEDQLIGEFGSIPYLTGEVQAVSGRVDAIEADFQWLGGKENIVSRGDIADLQQGLADTNANTNFISALQQEIGTARGTDAQGNERENLNARLVIIEGRATDIETAATNSISQIQEHLDNTVDTSITSLLSRATTAEGDINDLETALAAEISDRGVAVLAEQTRALAAESALSTAISTEVTDRGVAVLAEQDRALAAEAALSSDLSAVNTRVDNVLSNIDPAALDSLTEVVSAFQSADSSINGAITSLAESAAANLVIERDARIAADSAIDTTVSTLTDSIPDRVRAVLLSGLSLATNAAITASDSVLGAFGKLQAQVTAAFASIDSEVSTRQSDVQSVRTVTDNHEGRLTSAEGTIAGLGTMSTQNANAVNITGGTITGVSLNAQSMEVGQGSTADLYVGNDGKVGVGTEAPTEKLTVNGNIDILGGQVKNLGTPVAATDAATKGYVDTAVSGVQSALDTEIADRAAAVSAEETRALAAEAALEDTKQIKLVISDTAPAHIAGREWLDTTDFRRYISISSAWVESITA
jgi:hypothetical protein